MSEQDPAQNKADELYERAYGPARPTPEEPMDPGHRALLVLSVVTALAVTGYTALQITSMPEEIPVRFGFDGSIHSYGSAMTALWLPLGMTALVLFIAWFSTKPHWLNYPFVVTAENAQRAYRVGQQTMVQISSAVVIAMIGMVSAWVGWPLVWLTGIGTAVLTVMAVVGIIRIIRAR